MQENANNNEDEWEEWDVNEAESKEDQVDKERKLSCETEAASNKYESANQQKANLDLGTEEVHLATADEPVEKSEIEQKDDGDQELQQDNDATDMQLKQQNGLELILKEHILLLFGSAYFHSSVISRDIFSILLCIILVIVTSFCLIDE